MKKTLLTTAVVLIALCVNAQNNARQPKNEADKATVTKSQDAKAAEARPVQQETIMPDGTVAPSTTGDQEPAKARPQSPRASDKAVDATSNGRQVEKSAGNNAAPGAVITPAPNRAAAPASEKNASASDNSQNKGETAKDAKPAAKDKKAKKAADKKARKKSNQSTQ